MEHTIRLADARSSAAPRPWILGDLSKKYETGGRGPGTVSSGTGDPGGVSYGSYQMTSAGGGTVAIFVTEPTFPWRARFVGLTPGTPQFTNAWKQLAQEAPDAFQAAQHDFIRRTHFDPLCAKISAEDGLTVTDRSHALQDCVWSTAVQHGARSTIVHLAIAALGGLPPDDADLDRRLIVAIYAERGRRDENGVLVHFRNSSKKVQDGVAKRYVDEERDALRMLADDV